MNDTFLTRPRKQLRRTPFKRKNTPIKPKSAPKRKKSTRVKLVTLGKLQRTCDALMQQIGKLRNPVSLISNNPTQVQHHYIPKSCSSMLRYDWDNLIPLTNGEHCRLHQSPDPTTNILILQAKGGQQWFDKLKEKSREYNKVNRAYYEKVEIRLRAELKQLQEINNNEII